MLKYFFIYESFNIMENGVVMGNRNIFIMIVKIKS